MTDGHKMSFMEWYISYLDMEIENINKSLSQTALTIKVECCRILATM